MPFFSGSRYGRSNTNTGSDTIKNVEISPRPDRFFLGSRYGKRNQQQSPESAAGGAAASLRRLEAVLNYLSRVRRLDEPQQQHRQPHNYEIEQTYYDNGYDDNDEKDDTDNQVSYGK
uniref:Uncharacterized protein n=1 Tax=Bracon brevicornis TaxID=1563983 RepID=A0A6V7JWR8_9HYME